MHSEIRIFQWVASMVTGVVYWVWLHESDNLFTGKVQIRILTDLDHATNSQQPRSMWQVVRSTRTSPIAVECAFQRLERQGWATRESPGRYRITAVGREALATYQRYYQRTEA